MKFLIQKVNGKITHDFAFTLLEAIRYNKWLGTDIKVKYLDYIEVTEPNDIYPLQFKPLHKSYIPIGSVEFVSEFLGYFYGITPKPINVPLELFPFAYRLIYNGEEFHLYGKKFVKSMSKIKDICGIFNEGEYQLPIGDYQFSDVISIDGEWRAFVYKNKLVGLQNYCGEFTKFPNVKIIKLMIDAYASTAPIAYTLDIGVNDSGTFIIECHQFFSCGLYSFRDMGRLPKMFQESFNEIVKNNLISL
jgi:hypothetical protein